MKRLSKFDYGTFYGYGERWFAVSKQRFSIDEAMAMFAREFDMTAEEIAEFEIESAAVRWRAGVNEENEPQVGWWLEIDCDGSEPRCCPVWYFACDWGV